jgi:hypothetical protein
MAMAEAFTSSLHEEACLTLMPTAVVLFKLCHHHGQAIDASPIDK